MCACAYARVCVSLKTTLLSPAHSTPKTSRLTTSLLVAVEAHDGTIVPPAERRVKGRAAGTEQDGDTATDHVLGAAFAPCVCRGREIDPAAERRAHGSARAREAAPLWRRPHPLSDGERLRG